MSDDKRPQAIKPCADPGATHDSLTSESSAGPHPWARKIIYFGVAPASIDIEACLLTDGAHHPLPNYPFKLVIYGKASGFTPPPVIHEQVLQAGAPPPYADRAHVTGHHVEVHMILAPATAHYAFTVTPLPPATSD
jgi:hypothetical protein